MRDAALPPLEVEADLRVRVTAQTGESTGARITGDGSTLHVVADRPEVLFAAVSPADVGRLADLLAASGLVAHVTGPDGPVATVGTGVRSRVGRAVTGSVRVAPAPRAAVRIAAGTRAVRVAGVAVPLLAVAWWVLAVRTVGRRGPRRPTAARSR